MQPSPDSVMHMLAAVLGFYTVIFLVVLAAVVIPTWFICKKAGFSPWLSFILLIPLGGLVLLYVLAFAEWKVIPVPEAYWPTQPPIPPPHPPQPLTPQR